VVSVAPAVWCAVRRTDLSSPSLWSLHRMPHIGSGALLSGPLPW
jgi:hypothetical protein